MTAIEKEKRIKDLKKLVAKLNSKNDLRLGFGQVDPITFIPTPFPTLNELSGGGLPRGKYTTIAGPERTAKGTLLLQIIAHNMAIDPNFTVLWTDVEDALDESWCIALGVDMSRVLVQKYSKEVTYFEKLLDAGLELVKTGAIDMWVIDSVAALIPKAEDDKLIEDNAMLDLQRKLPLFLRKGSHVMSLANTACVLIGQIYNAPNATYTTEEVKGGNGLKHWAHLRFLTRRGNKQEAPAPVDVMMPDGTNKKLLPGWAMHIKNDKTRINMNEGQSVVLKFMYGRGLDSVNSAITTLFAHSVFEQSGAWFSHELLPDGKVQGRDKLVSLLESNDSLRTKLLQQLDGTLVTIFSEDDKEEPSLTEIKIENGN